jgi:hypothetical protein
VTLRRIVLTLVAALLLAGVARPADAAPRPHRHDRAVAAISLTSEGAGTLIRITYAGRHRHTRLLRSLHAIEALTVADVDNDGDLDIVAAGRSGGLLVWRNAGRGHFVFAATPPARTLTRRQTTFRRVLAAHAPDPSGDERHGAAMARAPDAAADLLETPNVPRASSLVLSPFSVASRGRAPPPAHT